MTDLIKRQDALNMKFSRGLSEDGLLYVPFWDVNRNIMNLPAVEAIPIEWIEEYMDKLDSSISKYTINSMVHQWKAERKEE